MRTLCSALLLALLVAPLSARAQEAPGEDQPTEEDLARAKEFFRNGSDLYEEGLYEEAILAFEEALALTGFPDFHYNIANCHERLGEYAEAIEHLNTYRAYQTGEERDKLGRRIRMLEKRLAEREASAPAPAPAPVAPAPAPPTFVDEPIPGRKALKIGLVAGGATLAVGFGSATVATYSLSRDHVSSGDRAAYESLRPWNNASLAVAGVGAAAAIVGLALPARRSVPSVAVQPLPQGALLVIGGRR